MGTGMKVFFVEGDGFPRRVPSARFERLCKCDPEERFPECAGRQVRCALVVVDTAGRKPVAARHVEYSLLTFDADGRLDRAALEEEMQLAVNSLELPVGEQFPSKVADSIHVFARKRHRHEYVWTPTPWEEAAIIDAALRRRRQPRSGSRGSGGERPPG